MLLERVCLEGDACSGTRRRSKSDSARGRRVCLTLQVDSKVVVVDVTHGGKYLKWYCSLASNVSVCACTTKDIKVKDGSISCWWCTDTDGNVMEVS